MPPKSVPSNVSDTAVHAVRAAGAELAGAPFVGTVPRGCVIEPLPASAASCAPFCALSTLLAACPPEEDQAQAAAAAPVTAAAEKKNAVPAKPPRAHSPDLFSDSDSDGEWQQTQAVEVAAAQASKPAAVPALAPAPAASAALPLARKAVAVGAEPMAWAEPHALAALMLRCDPFLSELGTLLCA